MKRKMLIREKKEKWISENPQIKSWLQHLQPKTQILYAEHSFKYFVWIKEEAPEPFKNKSPGELLDLQDACVRQREQFKQVEILKIYLNQKEGTYFTKRLIKSVIYSFYAHSHVPLPKDINFNVKPTREPVNGDLTIEELRSIILSSNKLYQAVFTIMFQSGMGENEFLYFNTHSWKQIKKQLDEGKKIIKIDLPGRKSRKMKPAGRYFTFFGKDGIEKLKQYLKVRGRTTRTGRIKRKIERPLPELEDCIFVNEKHQPLSDEALSTYFKRHAIKIGIIKKVYGKKIVRYRVHLHEMRDTFRKEWNLSDAKQFMSEFFMGHAIDLNDYNKVYQKQAWAEEQYSLAEPFLNILSEDPRVVSRKDVQTLQRELNVAKKQLEGLETLRINGKRKDLEISKLNEMVTTEFQKVYAAFDSLKEEHRKTMEELDREPKSTIPDPKALREEVRKEAQKVAKKLKEESSL